MTRTIKHVQRDLDGLAQSQARLQAELSQIENREREVLADLGEKMLAGNGGGDNSELALLRSHREGLQQALSVAGDKLHSLQHEFQNFEGAERAAAGRAVAKELTNRLAAMSRQAAALAVEVDQALEFLQNNAHALQQGTPDTSDLERVARRTLTSAGVHLVEVSSLLSSPR